MKGETIDRTMWRSRSGGGYGTFIRQTGEWMAWHAQTGSFQNMKSCENVRNYYEDIYISTTTSMEPYYHGIMIVANNEYIFKKSSFLIINNFFCTELESVLFNS